ncbi:MAG: regulatory iron-sulfur-containing complex subunit RicT [Spirochaetota bacterium]
MADFVGDGDEDLSHLEDETQGQDFASTGEAAAGENGGSASGSARGHRGDGLPSPLFRICASHSNETYFAWLEGEVLEPGMIVVAPTRYGKDLCTVQGLVNNPGRVNHEDLIKVDRIATADDQAKALANEEKERKAFELCRQKIDSRNLAMKLVTAHYLLEESKILFFFSAESRVDFRELVKDLVNVFKMRIELRQIGVRDEARVIGGCGVCGRVLCCHGVSDKLTPVSIKMAKDQNLSLNSMKISGPCGRLLCCLAYEYGFYRDARRELPGEGVRFPWDGTNFRVIEVNALSGTVKIAGEDGRMLEMPASRFSHAEGRWKVKDEEAAEKD